MLLSVIKYFKGYVYVRLSGYAPERFLNLCGSHDILIWNLKSTEDGYEFCISVAGFKQLRPILKKTRTHIRIQKRYGMPQTENVCHGHAVICRADLLPFRFYLEY